MSDAPKSWNDPNDVILGRDNAPVLTRDGAPIPVKRPAAEPLPEPGGRYEFHNHVHHHHTDPRVDAVLAELAGLSKGLGRHIAEAIEANAHTRSSLTDLRRDTMAAYADFKAQLDALMGNVDRVAAHAAEQNAKLDELVAIKDNGSEEEFVAAVEAMKDANGKLAAIGASPSTPVEGELPADPAAPTA